MTTQNSSFFASGLLTWYHANKRDLPWRHTRDPYIIWLSEIILQQTRVAQGLPYFLRFADAYPTVHDFANAPEDDILRHWQGLGYYSRARNMLQTAKTIVAEHNGQFPDSYHELLKLKGVGTYTAAAIASFAFNERVAVLDGNVYRVLARYFGVHENIAAPATKKIFEKLANDVIPAQNPDQYNQAIMEFGALHCTPLKPLCQTCPVQNGCYAFKNNLQQALPVKEKKKTMRVRYFTYLVLHHNGLLYMRKRSGKDIWQGLYEFPYIESAQPLATGLFMDEKITRHLPEGAVIENVSKEFKHQLSHQQIRAVFVRARLRGLISGAAAQEFKVQEFSADDVEKAGKPIMLEKYLKSYKL